MANYRKKALIMLEFKRVTGTNLLVPSGISYEEICFACLPLKEVSKDILTLAEVWPDVRLIFWKPPLSINCETFEEKFKIVADHFGQINVPSLVFVSDWANAPIKFDRAFLKKEGDLIKTDSNLYLNFEAGRYALNVPPETKVVFDKNYLHLKLICSKPVEFCSKKESDTLITVTASVNGELSLDLSTQGGAIEFNLDLTPESIADFGLEIRFTKIVKGEDDNWDTINSTRYIPVLGSSVDGRKTLPLIVQVDPLDIFNPQRSYLEISPGTEVEVQYALANGALLKMKAVKHPIPAPEGEVKWRAPRFLFTRQSHTLGGTDSLPIKDWQNLTLDGAFEPVMEDEEPDLDVLTGLSDTETFRLARKERLVFRRGYPAFLPTPTPLDSFLSSENGEANPLTLTDALTTAYVGVESLNGETVTESRTRVISEGSKTRLLALDENSGSTTVLRLHHAPLFLYPKNSDRAADRPASHFLPMLPLLYIPEATPSIKRKIDWERSVIQPQRRRYLSFPSAGSLTTNPAAKKVRATPSGLLVGVEDERIQALYLTRTVSGGSSVTFAIEGIKDQLAEALMRDRLFLIADTFGAGNQCLGKLTGRIDIGGWSLKIRFAGDDTTDSAARQPNDETWGFLIIKDDDRPLKNLVERPDLWAGYDATQKKNCFISGEIADAQKAIGAFFDDLKNRQKNTREEAKPAYNRILAIWDDEQPASESQRGWRGILVLKPRLSLGDLPPQLAALATTIKGKKVEAVYIGIDLNRLKKAANEELQAQASPVFGLVDYQDQDDLDGSSDYDMKLKRLLIRFENGAVHSFYSSLQVMLGRLFDIPLDHDEQKAWLFTIEGSRESRLLNGKRQDIYTFQSREPLYHEFKRDTLIFSKIVLQYISYSTVKADKETIDSRLTFSGEIDFNSNFPPENFSLLGALLHKWGVGGGRQLNGGLGPDRNRIRHPKPGDDIQGGKAGIGFGRLGIEAMVFQATAKEGFEAKHRRFGQAAPVITALLLPSLASVLLNPLQDGRARMGLVFGQGWPGDGSGAGWNQGECLAILHGLVTGVGIVSPIGSHGGDGVLGGELIQQVRQHLGISYQGGSQFCSDHFVRFGIHGQMEFTPRPTLAHAMLAYFPFPLTVDFQAGGVNDDMARLLFRQTPDPHRQSRCPAAERTVIGDTQRQSQQPHQRIQKPGQRAQGQPKHFPDHQPALQSHLCVATRRTAPPRAFRLIPTRHRCLIKPQRQRPPCHQRRVVGPPVRDPILPFLFVHPPDMGALQDLCNNAFLDRIPIGG